MKAARRSPSLVVARALLAALVAACAPTRAFAQDDAQKAPDPEAVLPAATGPASGAPDAADAASAGPPAVDPDLPPEVEVLTLGEGDQKVQLVDHGDCWSMHAESVMAMNIFRAWQEAGGPEVIMKSPLDYPYTLSVHRLSTERLVARILEGYGHTLHYGPDGRLEQVRVYSPKPARLYKTPRLVESLGTWRQVETAKPTHPDGTPEAPAPVPVFTPVPPPVPPRPQPVPESVDDPLDPMNPMN